MLPFMPDFTDALDERLRHEAQRAARQSRGARTVGAGAAAALAAAGALLLTGALGTPGQSSVARAAVQLTDLPPTVSGELKLRDVAATLGDDAVLERGWSVPALKGTVYLAHNDSRWCLSVPDPATSQPEIERGQSCASTSTYRNQGVSLTIGRRFVAVIPDGVPKPTAKAPDGTRTSLERIDRGLILAPVLAQRSVITRTTADGRTVTDRVDQPDVRVWNCPDSTLLVAPSSGPDPC